MKWKAAIKSIGFGGIFGLWLIASGLLKTRTPTALFSISAAAQKQQPALVESPDGKLNFYYYPDGSMQVLFTGKSQRDDILIAAGVTLIFSSIWSAYREPRKEEEARLEKEKRKQEELDRIVESPEYQDYLTEHPERVDSNNADAVDHFISWRAMRRNRARAQARKHGAGEP